MFIPSRDDKPWKRPPVVTPLGLGLGQAGPGLRQPHQAFVYARHKKVLTVDLVLASPWRRVCFCPESVRLDLMAERPREPLKKVELLIGKMIEYADVVR